MRPQTLAGAVLSPSVLTSLCVLLLVGGVAVAAPPGRPSTQRGKSRSTSKPVAAPRAPLPAARRMTLEEARAKLVTGGETRSMELDEARQAVEMLDDAYHLILEQTHATYHTRPNLPVAASVVRRVQAKMTELGWPRARFLAVNTIVMNPDHIPRDDFEQSALVRMRRSSERIDEVVDGKLRVATTVMLGRGCSSCHWSAGPQSGRAAITWSVPLRDASAADRTEVPAPSPDR